jgi:hypothetical protein
MIARRGFLALPLLAAAPARPVLTVGPGDSARLEGSLWLPSGAVFLCPPRRARLLAVLRLRAADVAAIAFACDPPGGQQDALALVGPDAALLALERLSWRGGEGSELNTRLAMLPDRVHITLERDAARHEQRWRRESWTDYVRFEGGALVDAPPRPVLAGTWQAGLSAQRVAMAAAIGRRTCRIPPALLAMLRLSALGERPSGHAGQEA